MLNELKLKEVLKQILTDHTADPTFTPLEVVYQGNTLYEHSQIFDQFAYNYSAYSVTVSDIYQPTTAFFCNLWLSYVNETAAQLKRQMDAMAAEYDPISNYDLTEHAADGEKLDKETETSTPTGGTQTVSNAKLAGLNSTGEGAQRDNDVTTVTPLAGSKTELERQPANTLTGSFEDQTLTGHRITEHYLKRSGNIGVTTNAQMLQQEIEVRKLSLLRMYVNDFVQRYCFLVWGDDSR